MAIEKDRNEAVGSALEEIVAVTGTVEVQEKEEIWRILRVLYGQGFSHGMS